GKAGIANLFANPSFEDGITFLYKVAFTCMADCLVSENPGQFRIQDGMHFPPFCSMCIKKGNCRLCRFYSHLFPVPQIESPDSMIRFVPHLDRPVSGCNGHDRESRPADLVEVFAAGAVYEPDIFNPFKIICPPAGYQGQVCSLLNSKKQYCLFFDVHVTAVLFYRGDMPQVSWPFSQVYRIVSYGC